jgi:hypothetical protein
MTDPTASSTDPAGTFEEWMVTGDPGEGYPTYRHVYSRRLNPDLTDPEGAARRFIANTRIAWWEGPYLSRRTVTVTEWERRS